MPTPTPVAPTPQITPEVINPQQPINNIEAAPILQPAAPVIENVIPQAPTVNELATPISPTIVPDAQNVATPIIQNPVEPTQSSILLLQMNQLCQFQHQQWYQI